MPNLNDIWPTEQEKSHSEPFWSNFGATLEPKNWKLALICQICILHLIMIIYDKFELILTYRTEKEPFGAISEPNMSQTIIFWKIPFRPFERSHLVLTSCNKSKKLLEPFLINMAKSRILGHFGPKRAHITGTRIFSEKPPCTFLALIVMNFHAKNQVNR